MPVVLLAVVVPRSIKAVRRSADSARPTIKVVVVTIIVVDSCVPITQPSILLRVVAVTSLVDAVVITTRTAVAVAVILLVAVAVVAVAVIIPVVVTEVVVDVLDVMMDVAQVVDALLLKLSIRNSSSRSRWLNSIWSKDRSMTTMN